MMKADVAKAGISAKSRSIPKDVMLHYRAEVDSTLSDVAATCNRKKSRERSPLGGDGNEASGEYIEARR